MNYLAAILASAALAGCAGQRVVEVPVPVEVPGPVQYREIPADMLTCDIGVPQDLRDGVTNGELRQAAVDWQAYAKCLAGKLEAIGGLGAR